MKIGISIPNNWGVEDPSRLVDLAVRAEEAGFASVWTSEHLINVSYVRDRIGGRPYHHPLTILSAIAARTRRIRLGTSVLVLPFHNPFDLAKYVATLDQLSRGRVILGIGVGNVREEFEALGIPWTLRGALTDETIDILRALWSPGTAAHVGKEWTFSDVHTAPKPFGGRRVPIWVGGMSGPALQRVAARGDGWHPTAISVADLGVQVRQLADLAREGSRGLADLDICMRFNIALDDMPVTEAELLSTIAGYDSERALGTARDYQAAGVTHFIFALNGHDPAILEETLDRIAREILPAFGPGSLE
jgi:probable F420-dependent oxidoreductase